MSADIGFNIRIRRREKQIKQREMAAALGINPARLCMMEKGKRPISVDILGKIAGILDCKVDELMFGERG